MSCSISRAVLSQSVTRKVTILPILNTPKIQKMKFSRLLLFESDFLQPCTIKVGPFFWLPSVFLVKTLCPFPRSRLHLADLLSNIRVVRVKRSLFQPLSCTDEIGFPSLLFSIATTISPLDHVPAKQPLEFYSCLPQRILPTALNQLPALLCLKLSRAFKLHLELNPILALVYKILCELTPS